MKDNQLLIQIEALAVLIESELGEPDTNRNCRLQDAKEHLRRAWLAVDGSTCQFNDLLCR